MTRPWLTWTLTNVDQRSPAEVGASAKAGRKWILLGVLGCGCVGFVLLAGIGAAIGIPAFVNYTKRSKTSEASANLRSMATAFRAQCESSQGGVDLAALRAGPLPAVPSSEQQTVSFAADPGFVAIGFDPGYPVRYSYSIGPSPVAPGEIVLQARGDLDDDGIQSLFEIACSPTTCACAPHPYIENELE